MFFRTKSKATANECGGRPIPAHVFQSHIMNKLDGASLAATFRAYPLLFSSCDDKIWRKICNSVWPSTTDDPRVLSAISHFPSAHRSFYYDSFPSASYRLPRLDCLSSETSELISAVDIYYKDEVIYSKVLQTRTLSDQFFSNPLELKLLGQTETVPTPLKYHNGDECEFMSLAKRHLRVSWILIDPYIKRAVNIASHNAVGPDNIQINGDIQLRYATVAAVSNTGEQIQFAVLATCGWRGRELHVKVVRMEISDLEKRSLNGRESLRVIQMAMAGRRRRMDSRMEKAAYTKFRWMEEEIMSSIFAAVALLFLLSLFFGSSIAAAIYAVRDLNNTLDTQK